MPELPACVRLALWTTHAWANGSPLEDAVARALPDVDHVGGDLERLSLWHDLGEHALLVALPAPGDPTGMPGTSPEALGAAADAGECVFVPGLGGMLVPTISTFGAGQGVGLDVGTRVDWAAYEADPVPRHRVEAVDVSQLERHLRQELMDVTERLETVGGQPFAREAARELADTALGGRWGLPAGLPGRTARVIALASTVGSIVDLALTVPDGSLSATQSVARNGHLRTLGRVADHALAESANAAVSVLAGWRPA
jgi:hypothetical protein